jgi:CDGSH-type Zn-finger protein
MTTSKPEVRVTVSRNGPYIVTGDIPLAKQTIGVDAEGASETWIDGEAFPQKEVYALCRCGASLTKPFCDGAHLRVGFDGAETASREAYVDQAKMMQGPVLSLSDAESLCAFARFCDPHGQVWGQVAETDDPQIKARFVAQVNACPSGRLVAGDNATGQPVEETLPVSIGVVEDPAETCAGPLWLRGGVAVIGADGFAYEVRNRVTLCRCGASNNKPFCDGSHASIKFQDG